MFEDRPELRARRSLHPSITSGDISSMSDAPSTEVTGMPSGLLILIVGAAIGAAAGWLILGEPVVGGGAGFIFAFLYLLIASWLDRREDQVDG